MSHLPGSGAAPAAGGCPAGGGPDGGRIGNGLLPAGGSGAPLLGITWGRLGSGPPGAAGAGDAVAAGTAPLTAPCGKSVGVSSGMPAPGPGGTDEGPVAATDVGSAAPPGRETGSEGAPEFSAIAALVTEDAAAGAHVTF